MVHLELNHASIPPRPLQFHAGFVLKPSPARAKVGAYVLVVIFALTFCPIEDLASHLTQAWELQGAAQSSPWF